MKRVIRNIRDGFNRAKIRIQLFFTRNPERIKNLWITYGLYTKEGRKILAEAMISGVRLSLIKKDYSEKY